MASFTDAISQFNPYVQQLPVEAMVQVGMQKQQKYDEGVQKIQSYIDNIAGLDVMKSEHKQYLQSKLNELGSNLKSVAAGDFSNQQLVNSVGGMASQIIKDPTIQNAVSSTQQVRKQMTLREEAQKAGKSGIVNDWKLDQQINDWLSDKNMNSSFRGKYRQYIDVDKKLYDIADKVEGIDSSVDQPFKTDAAGNTLYFVLGKDGQPQIGADGRPVTTTPDKGTPIVDEAMKTITAKGKSAPKLLANFLHGLNEDDMEQLKMNAEYHYQGNNLDALKKDLAINVNTQKKMMMTEAVDLDLELKTNSKLSDVEKAKMQARITDINQQMKDGTLDKKLAQRLNQLSDPATSAQLKAQLYTENYLSSRAADIANLSYSQSIKDNPYMQVQLKYKDLQARYDQMAQADKHFQATYAQSERHFATTTSLKIRELEQKERELKALEPLAFDAPMSTGIESLNMGMIDQKVKDGRDAIKVLDGRYAGSIAKNQATPEAKKKFLDDLYAKYERNPSSITDNTQREYLQQRHKLEGDVMTNMNIANRVRQETAGISKELDAALAGAKGVTFANGAPLFSGKDLFEVRAALDSLPSSTTIGYGGAVQKRPEIQRQNADALVKRFRGTRLEPVAVAYAKQIKGATLSPTERTIVSIGDNISSTYKKTAIDIAKKKTAKEAELLNQYLPERQSRVGIINPENKNDQARLQMLMGLKADEFARMGALDTDLPDDYTPENFKALRESKTTIYTIERMPDGSGVITARDGDISVKFPATATQLATALPSVGRTHPFDEFKYTINSSPSHTTNKQGLTDEPGAAVSAKYTGYYLPGLKNTKIAPLVRYDIEGSESNNGGPSDGFQVRLYVNQGGIWKSKVLNQSGWATPDGIIQIINNIGPTTVNDVLK